MIFFCWNSNKQLSRLPILFNWTFSFSIAALRLPEWETGDKCKASRVLDCRSVTLSAFCTGWMTVSLYICFACKQQGGNVLGGWQMEQGDSAMSNGDISHLLLRHYSLPVYRLPYGQSIWGEQCDALQGLCWVGCFWIAFGNTKPLCSYALAVQEVQREWSFYCWYWVSFEYYTLHRD